MTSYPKIHLFLDGTHLARFYHFFTGKIFFTQGLPVNHRYGKLWKLPSLVARLFCEHLVACLAVCLRREGENWGNGEGEMRAKDAN